MKLSDNLISCGHYHTLRIGTVEVLKHDDDDRNNYIFNYYVQYIYMLYIFMSQDAWCCEINKICHRIIIIRIMSLENVIRMMALYCSHKDDVIIQQS